MKNFIVIFNPRENCIYYDLVKDGVDLPLIIGHEYEVKHSKINTNLDILKDGAVSSSYPMDWFELK